MTFTKHTTETAPEESKELLKKVLDKFGFIPNQDKILAISPSIYKAYNQSFDLFLGKSSLGLLEGQVVIMTTSYENNSPYCMAVHSWGMKMTKVPKDVIESLRNGKPIADSRLETLRDFTRKLIINKGHIDEKTLSNFFEIGFTQENCIEIIGGIAAKTISNYVNIVAKTEVDEIMEQYKWSK
ncbi:MULTISPECIES: carboxymuconolactone decarboxylase family protein [Flavobacterium]|uniref:Carboxymuconolactone decarboxylase family protein n=1 Tax=Flavobacterium jumunjinense TaxID=998845 RepID=A0ABV5GNH3_9FLAO|nr:MULTISPECIES: carboxymuconolactone decarboxylase family protein [Flavobacterium]